MDISILRNRNLSLLFWLIVILKLISGGIFASSYLTEGFVPFVKYLITTGNNPYDFFFANSNIVFPYPAGMLYIVSFSLYLGHFFIENIFSNTFIVLLFFRLPILIADILIYIVLCKLLPSKEFKVLLLYFCSPILFYINYYHGQLDVIPTSFLILSLYFLLRKKNIASFLLLGIGITSKSHLFIALPFYVIYLIKQREKLGQVLLSIIIPLAAFFIFNIPFFSKGFISTVFNNVEQQRLFFVYFPYYYKNLVLLIAPAALLLSFYKFASYKRLNFDSLILTLGLVFTILIALVPPMQGWFYWSIPLFIFFLIKYKDSQLLSFWMMNIFFIGYFVFTKDSDIFESASIFFPNLAYVSSPYRLLENYGFNSLLIQNVLFTCLQMSVAMNAFWCYRLGIYYNDLYIEKQKPFMLGIAGDSGVGKSTLSERIRDLVGVRQLEVLNGDDSHKWERNSSNWRLFTHLNPKANKIHEDVDQLYALVDGKTIERVTYSHKTGKFSRPKLVAKNQFIVFQGLHPFFLDAMREIYDLKIYIETEEKLRKKWKTNRDVKFRGYSVSNVRKSMQKRTKDASKFILPQKKFADWIINYSLRNGSLHVKYTFENSVPFDELLKELSMISGFKIKHEYIDIKNQAIEFEGKISKNSVVRIAYKLYPSLEELINNQPTFRENNHGIHQLFFLNYLNFYYKGRNLIG